MYSIRVCAAAALQNEAMKSTLKLYDDALERYIPVLMGMARIYWDRENYPQVRAAQGLRGRAAGEAV
jgi:hypothetical protein